jgi:hypothetical protein
VTLTDDNPMIGREVELKTLEEAVTGTRSGLVLIVGGPGTGKGRLLRELRARAAAYPCRLVPPDPADDVEPPGLLVDKQCTVDTFRRATAPPPDAEVNADYSMSRDFDLILVYGYRPEEDFHDWFTGEFLPGLAEVRPPRMVVVAGSAGDVAALEHLADRQVVLGPLPRDAVLAELRAIDAGLADRLQEPELELYADAIVGDPALLGALRQVLPLTTSAQVAEGTHGED